MPEIHRLKLALDALFDAVMKGQEYPDASAWIAVKFGVRIEKLTAAYDAVCADESWELEYEKGSR